MILGRRGEPLVDKYVIEVKVPALGKKLEFMVPPDMETVSAKKLILDMVYDSCLDLAQHESDMWLVDLEDHKQIPEKATCREAGLKNGSKLMLLWIN